MLVVVGTIPAGTPGWVNRTNAHFNYIYARVDPALVDIYRGTPCPKVYVLDKNLKIRYISLPSNALPSNQPTLEDVAHLLGIEYQPPRGGSPRFNNTAPTARSTRATAMME